MERGTVARELQLRPRPSRKQQRDRHGHDDARPASTGDALFLCSLSV
jgi:hypothetical protein